jgi:hypothetical protein
MGGDNAVNGIQSGKCEDCAEPSASSCIDQEYTINGASFPCHADIFDDTVPLVPSPVFVLS